MNTLKRVCSQLPTSVKRVGEHKSSCLDYLYLFIKEVLRTNGRSSADYIASSYKHRAWCLSLHNIQGISPGMSRVTTLDARSR